MDTTALRNRVHNAIRLIERNPRAFACSWEALFKGTPDGDFAWEGEEAGDWVCTEDEDYGEGWCKHAFAMTVKRKDGAESVEFSMVDCDGNWDFIAGFGREDADSEGLAFELATQSCHYQLLQNALYSLYVVETGEDPLDTTWGEGSPREVHARDLESEIASLCSYVEGKVNAASSK
jgi:hypothetical protein